jgi:hypothetical protein
VCCSKKTLPSCPNETVLKVLETRWADAKEVTRGYEKKRKDVQRLTDLLIPLTSSNGFCFASTVSAISTICPIVFSK